MLKHRIIAEISSIVGSELYIQPFLERKGTKHNRSRKTEGDRRREETRETAPYLCKQQHAWPWQNTHQTWARQDWHAKSPWHMLARWHPVCSCLARADKRTHIRVCHSSHWAWRKGEGGRRKKRRWERNNWVHMLPIINAFTSGWRGKRGMGDETKEHCWKKEMDRWQGKCKVRKRRIRQGRGRQEEVKEALPLTFTSGPLHCSACCHIGPKKNKKSFQIGQMAIKSLFFPDKVCFMSSE